MATPVQPRPSANSCFQDVSCSNGAAGEPDRIVIVEVCLKSNSIVGHDTIRGHVETFLQGIPQWYSCTGRLPFTEQVLEEHVESITICQNGQSTRGLFFWQVKAEVLVYKLHTDGSAEDDEVDDGVPAYSEWELPNREFHDLWETLIYDTDIQRRLVSHATTSLLFAQSGVNSNLVAWNKVVLLHGPPGTGKTSLCKALAQNLSIRLNRWFKMGHLIEVNAHSLFSKWFSESGKLVTKLFSKIMEFVEEADELVFVLIDEVESLTSARRAAVTGSEPSDAIRAVNSLLTHLDALKRHANVMVLCTSNLPEAVDVAFVDRADIKAYIGPPSVAARYEILRSCVEELQRTGLISAAAETLPLPWAALEEHSAQANPESIQMDEDDPSSSGAVRAALPASRLLRAAAHECKGLSGRTLRKLPFLAHAAGQTSRHCSSEEFIMSLHAVAKQEASDRASLTTG